MHSHSNDVNPLRKSFKQIIGLLRLMMNGTMYEREVAKQKLGELSADRLFALFQEVILRDEPFRELVTWGLLQLNPDTAINTLVSLLPVTNEDTRRDICGNFSNYHDSRVIGALLNCLQDDSPNVRTMAAFALGKVGSQNEISILRELVVHDGVIDDEGIPVSFSAEEAIREIRRRMKRK